MNHHHDDRGNRDRNHGHHQECHDHGDRHQRHEGHGHQGHHGHHESHQHCGPDRDGSRDRQDYSCDCGCGDDVNPFGFQRHFVSDDEVVETLEEYLTDLENEAQGVREAIAELKEALAEERADTGEAKKPKKPKGPKKEKKSKKK